VERWSRLFTPEEVRRVCLHGIGSPPTILNAAHASAPLPAGLAPHADEGFRVFEGSRAELVALLDSRADLWAQDPASASAVRRCAASGIRPRLIVDLCAGRGTKTRQLAASFPGAQVIASDVTPERLAALSRVFAGNPRVRVLPRDGVDAAARAAADLLLLDVPCSNTGVLARRVEARYRAGPDSLAQVTELQRSIIEGSLRLLAPGALIAYSTCSLEPEENEVKARWIAEVARYRIGFAELGLPRGGPGRPASGHRDGAYVALLMPAS
jgi:16S rRNA (cytosine967-C5)-methyltransferase